MAFEPKTWADGEEGGTPITAAELNRIEQGVESASQPQPAPAWGDVTGKPATFPAADHKHDAADIDSGTLAAARIPNLAQSKVTGLVAALEEKAGTADLTALETRIAALEDPEV